MANYHRVSSGIRYWIDLLIKGPAQGSEVLPRERRKLSRDPDGAARSSEIGSMSESGNQFSPRHVINRGLNNDCSIAVPSNYRFADDKSGDRGLRLAVANQHPHRIG